MKIKRMRSVSSFFLSCIFCYAALFLWGCAKQEKHELRLLCWIGYDEPDFLQLVEQRTGVKIVAKSFVGGDQMMAFLRQDPNAYDVVVVDPEYVSLLAKADKIEVLPKAEFDFSDYFPSFRDFSLCYDSNKDLRAILVRFGVNGLLYNTQHLSASDVKSYHILWSEKLKGRVLLFDWYLPNMGVFSRIEGNRDHPYSINDRDFEKVARSMDRLRPNVRAIQGSFGDMIAALANGEVWVQPTAGESLASTLQQMGAPIDWVVPEEGGIMWCETLALVKGTPHRQTALKFLHFMQTAEAQAALVRRKAYIGSVPNAKAYALLTPEEKKVLKISNEEDAEALIGKLSVRVLPDRQKPEEWQARWQLLRAGQPTAK